MKHLFINRKNPYQIINLTFLGIILLIFLYSVLFSPEKNNYPIKSSYTAITGKTSISSGLSHGFSCIVRGRFEQAVGFNPYSIQLFSFFTIQFFMRLIILIYICRIEAAVKAIAVKTDIIVSSVLFLLFFYPFLADTLKG